MDRRSDVAAVLCIAGPTLRRSDVAAVLCIAGPTLRRSFELPVKRARSFDRRSNVPGLLIGTGQTYGPRAKSGPLQG